MALVVVPYRSGRIMRAHLLDIGLGLDEVRESDARLQLEAGAAGPDGGSHSVHHLQARGNQPVGRSVACHMMRVALPFAGAVSNKDSKLPPVGTGIAVEA